MHPFKKILLQSSIISYSILLVLYSIALYFLYYIQYFLYSPLEMKKVNDSFFPVMFLLVFYRIEQILYFEQAYFKDDSSGIRLFQLKAFQVSVKKTGKLMTVPFQSFSLSSYKKVLITFHILITKSCSADNGIHSRQWIDI